jgi:hypothetical protein
MRHSKEGKLKRFPQGNLSHEQFFRRKGDDSKFLNGGRYHVDVDVDVDVDVNAWFTLIFFLKWQKNDDQ